MSDGDAVRRRGAAWGVGAAALLLAAPAAAQRTDYGVTGQAFGGASSNPFLLADRAVGSKYVGFTISPYLNFTTERGAVLLTGSYQLSNYFRRYDTSESYNASVAVSRNFSSNLAGHLSANFDSSIVGQTGQLNQTYNLVNGLVPTAGAGGVGAVVTDPALDLTVIPNSDVTVLGRRARSNSLRGAAGFSWTLSPRNSVTVDASVQRSSYGGDSLGLVSSTGYGGTLGYSRTLSERTQVGAQVSAQFQNFGVAGSRGSVVQPQFTINTRAGAAWSVGAAVGLLFNHTRTIAGTDNQFGLSLNAHACHNGERSNYCLRVNRDGQTTGLGDVATRLSSAIDGSIQLGQRDSVSGTAEVSRLSQTTLVALAYANAYAVGSAQYQHTFSRRVGAGAGFSYRTVLHDRLNRSADYSGSLFLRVSFERRK